MNLLAYHQRTKHHLSGYARGPETIDWERQPSPFRIFAATPLFPLPLQHEKPTSAFATVCQGTVPAAPLTWRGLSAWLEHGVALSAWKQAGNSRWSLRINPSSGNLHPTETYLIIEGWQDPEQPLADGLYHYRPDCHALALRCRWPQHENVDSTQLENRPSTRITVGLTSVPWREMWKYGERAFRYCQHDIGHAIAALDMGAALMGWRLSANYPVAEPLQAQLLGTNRAAEFFADEREIPELLLALQVHPDAAVDLPPHWQQQAEQGEWFGQAQRLDHRHMYQWPVVAEAASASQQPATNLATEMPPDSAAATASESDSESDSESNSVVPLPPLATRVAVSGDDFETAAMIIRRRRSAQAFDGQTVMPLATLAQMLDHVLMRPECPPWRAMRATAQVHLLLFIHRVEGLKPGLYLLPRSDHGEVLLRQSLRAEFMWERVAAGLPEHLPLYQLIAARAEKTIAKLSCLQAIARDGAFSLGMLVECGDALNQAPWRYRDRFWECGAIGQMLYLQAEALGWRGTGIGCYFDDAIHELIGLYSSEEGESTWPALQSFYHFTVGMSLQDNRLISLPPYSAERIHQAERYFSRMNELDCIADADTGHSEEESAR